VTRDLLNSQEDAVAVKRLQRHRLEDQQVERTRKQVGGLGHCVGSPSLARQYRSRLLVCQGEQLSAGGVRWPVVDDPVSKAPDRIAGMFDAIALRYDLLNHLLSAGIDRRWRKRAVGALALTGAERVLDLCTGTGDLAIAAATALPGA